MIKVENLTKTFGDVLAVDRISFEINPGEIFGLLGPNGAGKTTTIRILLGLLEPTDGHVEVVGCDVRTQAEKIRSQTGALLEHPGLYDFMSAEDNLEFYGRIWRIPPEERAARICELLTHIGLWERRNDLVGSWSRGMKQKLALTRSFLHQPSLVFLDEPTAGLDVEATVNVRKDLANLAAYDGLTVFLTTHNMAEVEKICDQVAIIRSGRLVAFGSPDELQTRGKNSRVVITGSGFNDAVLNLLHNQPEVITAKASERSLTIDLDEETEIASIVSLLVGMGVQVSDIHHHERSLEEIYLKLMEEEI